MTIYFYGQRPGFPPSTLPRPCSDDSSTPTRSSLSSSWPSVCTHIPRMSAVLFDVVSRARPHTRRAARPPPARPMSQCRRQQRLAARPPASHCCFCDTSKRFIRGVLQLVTLTNSGSAKHFHGAWRRLCKSRAVIDVQVFDRQGHRVSVRRHHFARQHVPTIFIQSRWRRIIAVPHTPHARTHFPTLLVA